jgi:hypothetical protein
MVKVLVVEAEEEVAAASEVVAVSEVIIRKNDFFSNTYRYEAYEFSLFCLL